MEDSNKIEDIAAQVEPEAPITEPETSIPVTEPEPEVAQIEPEAPITEPEPEVPTGENIPEVELPVEKVSNFRGHLIISENDREVEGRTYKHIRLDDGSELDLSEAEYAAEVY